MMLMCYFHLFGTIWHGKIHFYSHEDSSKIQEMEKLDRNAVQTDSPKIAYRTNSHIYYSYFCHKDVIITYKWQQIGK